MQKEDRTNGKTKLIPVWREIVFGRLFVFSLKEILIAEYLEAFGEDITKEEEPYPYYSLVHVTNTEPEPQGTEVYVQRYRTENFTGPKSLSNLMEDIEKALIIPREVYDYAANLINKVSSEIIEEIKKEYYA